MKAMKKMSKTVRVSFDRNLEINQRLAITQGALTQEKQLNLC